ncbi:unnamed protein product [Danaus chrysippus]|uniref:MCF.2 cell line derived transforming sequence like protein n=2 Tax=Danaus TaxID=13036 RepID=A0A212ES81_DANPL|nr:putative MCF.2 cell line derived transforming sequence like protein [Danaus plexippus plexippus]CAG9581128.1 unnamed protein product [Danaus chrysippus]
MATSPTSIETQIDSFLEQFKRSASKAMEERMEWPDGPSPAIVRSRSSCFTLDSSTSVYQLRIKGEKGEFDSFFAMTIWPNIPREFDPLCDNET